VLRFETYATVGEAAVINARVDVEVG